MKISLLISALILSIASLGIADTQPTLNAAQAKAAVSDARFQKFMSVMQQNYGVKCKVPTIAALTQSTAQQCTSGVCLFKFKVTCLGEPTLEDIIVKTAFEDQADYVGDISFTVKFQE